ncbi:hypothetical protein GPALN_011715 [Globodera pallida]|nr:hypothetical protein GPALN_011715 [Globodera pallida]
MKLNVVVLIVFAILALSAICKAGGKKEEEKKQKDADTKSRGKAPNPNLQAHYYQTIQNGDNPYWDEKHYDDDTLIQPKHESSDPNADSSTELQAAVEYAEYMMRANAPPNQQATASVDRFAQSPSNVLADSEDSLSWLYDSTDSSDSSAKSFGHKPKRAKKN